MRDSPSGSTIARQRTLVLTKATCATRLDEPPSRDVPSKSRDLAQVMTR